MSKNGSLLKLSSPAFEEGQNIPSLYTCDGKDLIPPLNISNIPKETKSLTLILEDPDTSIGIFDHWIVFNIPPTTTTITEGGEPQGIHGRATSGEKTYVSPCPPTGVHRYVFTVYALNSILSLPEGAKKSEVLESMSGHVLGQAVLMGKYGR